MAALGFLLVLSATAWLAASGRPAETSPREPSPPPVAMVDADKRTKATIILLATLGFIVAVDVVALMYGADSRVRRLNDYGRPLSADWRD